jgi:DNA-binding NtrC family response regulator
MHLPPRPRPLRLAPPVAAPDSDPLAALVGAAPAMERLRRALRAAAASDATVLLAGETGTGKGVAARALHAVSPRAAGPFVHVDCAALAPSVIESELFGHERGAFTGADAARAGRLERASGGTLFLDEVAELAPALQAKLLRALQDRAFERVGGARTLALAARVVAASHVDLAVAVAAGRFRADLYYRLQVIELALPPLRDRLADLPALVEHLLAEAAERAGRSAPRVTPEFLAALASHPWPGNLRELANLLERLLVLGAGAVLGAGDLAGVWAPARIDPTRAGVASATLPPAAPLAGAAPGAAPAADPEAARIAAALAATGGHVARTARRLGLPRSTLRHRIVRYGLAHLIPRD